MTPAGSNRPRPPRPLNSAGGAGSGVCELPADHPLGIQLADRLERQRPTLGRCAHLDEAGGGVWWQELPAIVCRVCAETALQRLPPGKSMPQRAARCNLCGGAEPVTIVAVEVDETAVLAALCTSCLTRHPTHPDRELAAEHLDQAVLFIDAAGFPVLSGDHPAGRQLVEQLQVAVQERRARQCGHATTTRGLVVWLPNVSTLTCGMPCTTAALTAGAVSASCALCGSVVDGDDPPWWSAAWDRVLTVAMLCPACTAQGEAQP